MERLLDLLLVPTLLFVVSILVTWIGLRTALACGGEDSAWLARREVLRAVSMRGWSLSSSVGEASLWLEVGGG